MRGDEEVLYVGQDLWYSILWDRSAERYYLEVAVGGSAMYERRMRLNDEEIASFRADPESLRTLALRVIHWPERYPGRIE